MPTCRTVIKDALRALKAIAPGDDPHVDQLNDGVSALQNLVLELHEARGPLRDVDVSAGTYIPGEDQRVRIQAGATTVVTLPNAVPVLNGFDPYDYGFSASAQAWGWAPLGTTAAADGVQYRQPRDGARIEVVGTTHQLFFYRADINQWVSAYALRLDDELPLNARYTGALGAVLADRLMESVSINEPAPGLIKRIARANMQLRMRAGTHHPPARIQNF